MEATHFESLYPADARFSEIEKILTLVKEGKSCQIVAVPGIGRSDILRLLAYNKDVREKHLGENVKWFHFVLLDFSEVRKRPLVDVLKFVFLGLVDSLRERNLQNEYILTNTIFKESLSLNDELVLFQGLKQAIDLLAIEKELTVCFLFDKFEDYVPTIAPGLFTNLKVLRNRAKYRFSVIFSLNRPIENMVEPSVLVDFSDLLLGNIVYLQLMDSPSLSFRRSYIEKVSGKSLEEKTYQSILSLTGGHGQLTRLGTEIFLTQKEIPLDLSSFLLQEKLLREALYNVWNTFSPEEQTILEKAAKNEAVTNEYLEKTGMLNNGEVAIPLLKNLILSNLQKPPPDEHIVFDTATNEIKKGYIVLSDTLTPLEYRLLSFLLHNREKIVTREEIILSVWKEDKTTAGVTDQALDQLMFRLRKKIEDNPNNPVHLQTVKGRGFKFTP